MNKGHLKKDCRAPKKKGERKQETTQEANVAGDVLQDTLILALYNTSDYWHYYISIQNPTEKSDGAWIYFFKPTKNHKDNFFFENVAISVA